MKKPPNQVLEELLKTMMITHDEDLVDLRIKENYQLTLEELVVLDALVSSKVVGAMKSTWLQGGHEATTEELSALRKLTVHLNDELLNYQK